MKTESPAGDAKHKIVIVGAGPSGVATLRSVLEAEFVKSVTLVDPNSVGFGDVFGPLCAADPMLMCNSTTGLTWVNPDDHDDFVNYLIDRGWPVGREEHVPRYLFGEYTRQRYHDYVESARAKGVTVRHVRAYADAVRKENGAYRVVLRDGTELDADDVVLTAGIGQDPVSPPEFRDCADHLHLIHGAYPVKKLRELPQKSHVLVIGLRSSALDASLVLRRAGHTVVLTSASGRLSAVRTALRKTEKQHLDIEALRAIDPNDPEIEAKVTAIVKRATESAGDGRPAHEQATLPSDTISRLHADITLAEERKTHWADLIFDIINGFNEIVSYWDKPTRQRLLGKAYEPLTRYVTALPLLYAYRLREGIEAKQVRISKNRMVRATPKPDGFDVEWADGSIEHFDYIVTTIGFYFPRYVSNDGKTVRLVHEGQVTPQDTIAEITPDLSLRLQPDQPPERIFAVGAATNQRLPFSHLIWLGAHHSRQIMRTLGAEPEQRKAD